MTSQPHARSHSTRPALLPSDRRDRTRLAAVAAGVTVVAAGSLAAVAALRPAHPSIVDAVRSSTRVASNSYRGDPGEEFATLLRSRLSGELTSVTDGHGTTRIEFAAAARRTDTWRWRTIRNDLFVVVDAVQRTGVNPTDDIFVVVTLDLVNPMGERVPGVPVVEVIWSRPVLDRMVLAKVPGRDIAATADIHRRIHSAVLDDSGRPVGWRRS